MVSFQCEACGDVFTKKKLDNHRNQCRNASYTCLDCMTHFRGNDYKSHTSCVSEDQKYQGALYKEKKKSVKIAEPNGHKPRAAYVEDDPETTTTAVSVVEVLPEAPVPPSATPAQSNVNVFDFLVNDETPNASKISLAPGTHKPLDYIPSVLSSDIAMKKEILHASDPHYDKHGFSYGNDPLPSPPRQKKEKDRPRLETITPGTRDLRRELEKSYVQSSEKKRKRHPEDLDLTATRASSHDSDALMEDAPSAPSLHSGLTGGLTRLLSRSSYSPTPDPPSPIKRSKSTSASQLQSQSLVVKDADRERSKSRLTASSSGRRRRSSDESRPRKKKHRTHSSSRTNDDDGGSRHSHHRRKHRKAIEYPSTIAEEGEEQAKGGGGQQLVKFATRAEFFMSLITKGEDSNRGMSVHKVLKRYHRERGREREGEEKELFRGLRVRKNERGEVVVFF